MRYKNVSFLAFKEWLNYQTHSILRAMRCKSPAKSWRNAKKNSLTVFLAKKSRGKLKSEFYRDLRRMSGLDVGIENSELKTLSFGIVDSN